MAGLIRNDVSSLAKLPHITHIRWIESAHLLEDLSMICYHLFKGLR
jgi:hypothetical protein